MQTHRMTISLSYCPVCLSLGWVDVLVGCVVAYVRMCIHAACLHYQTQWCIARDERSRQWHQVTLHTMTVHAMCMEGWWWVRSTICWLLNKCVVSWSLFRALTKLGIDTLLTQLHLIPEQWRGTIRNHGGGYGRWTQWTARLMQHDSVPPLIDRCAGSERIMMLSWRFLCLCCCSQPCAFLEHDVIASKCRLLERQ